MSLVDQLDTVTDASAGTVDPHATTQTFESTTPRTGAVVGVFPVHDAEASARRSSAPGPPRSSGRRSASTAARSGWPPGAATSPAG